MDGHRMYIVTGDDWSGMYIDGSLYAEGHEISKHDFFDAINEFKTFEWATSESLNKTGNNWLENIGRFPAKITDIPKECFYR